MSCEYCKGDGILIDTATKLSKKADFYPGVTVGIDDGELWVNAIADTYEPSYQEVSVKIKFCPMCGESLENS